MREGEEGGCGQEEDGKTLELNEKQEEKKIFESLSCED